MNRREALTAIAGLAVAPMAVANVKPSQQVFHWPVLDDDSLMNFVRKLGIIKLVTVKEDDGKVYALALDQLGLVYETTRPFCSHHDAAEAIAFNVAALPDHNYAPRPNGVGGCVRVHVTSKEFQNELARSSGKYCQ